MHKACETGDLSGLGEEQVELVQSALLTAKIVADDLVNDFPGLEWERIHEMKVELKDITFGTADVVLISKCRTVAAVCDYKFVSVSGKDYDLQLQTYASALVEIYPTLQHIRTVVIAPRIEEVDRKEYDAQDLYKKTRAYVEELTLRADNPFSPPTQNDELCCNCVWQDQCPALGRHVVEIVKPAVALAIPEKLRPDAVVTPLERALRRSMADTVAPWAEAVKEADNEFAKQGGTMPGYKVVTRSTGISIPKENTHVVVQKLLELGYTMDEILSTVKLSAKQLAEAHVAVTAENPEVEIDRLKAELAEYVTEGSTTFFQKSKSNKAQTSEMLFAELAADFE